MVQVVGAKFVEGVGKKSGKPYQAYIVHYVSDGEDEGFIGQVTGDAFIEKSLLNGHIPMPGDQMELFYNKNGFLTKVSFA